MESINDIAYMKYRHRIDRCSKCGIIVYKFHECESNPYEDENYQRGFDRLNMPDSIPMDDE